MAAKRQHPSDWSVDADNNGYDEGPRSQRVRRPRSETIKKPLQPPRQKATVKELALDERHHVASAIQIEDHILDRIKKCIERANHPNTTEPEAKAALFLSTKLMRQHDVTTADLLARDEANNITQYGGGSIVSIRNTKGGDRRIIHERFVSSLAWAMNIFFSCKSYSTRYKHSIEWTFYGIAGNTVAAAVAFEMVHNRILEWARHHRGKSASFSYCMGVADGLYGMAKEEKRQEQKAARQNELEGLVKREHDEEEQRQRELARLDESAANGSVFGSTEAEEDLATSDPSVKSENSDSENSGDYDTDHDDDDSDGAVPFPEPDFKHEEDEFLDPTADLDQEIDRILKRERTPQEDPDLHDIEAEEEEGGGGGGEEEVENPTPSNFANSNENNMSPMDLDSTTSPWASEMQLTRFRQTAEKVADDFLKEKNIKFHNRKRRHTSVKDYRAYATGKEDSKKIDVRQRRLEK